MHKAVLLSILHKRNAEEFPALLEEAQKDPSPYLQAAVKAIDEGRDYDPDAEKTAKPLVHAHAHNDYEHPRPLHDALQYGFCSVEADIHLVDGKLYVAHDESDIQPQRTLESLYLKPLTQLARRNNNRVYPGGPSIILLIDIKSDAEETYAVLRNTLKRYSGILTEYSGDDLKERAVNVIISGNRPIETIAADPVRLCAIDGRTEDLIANPPARLVPLISENWNNIFQWKGEGEMPDNERKKLQAIVAKTHAQKRLLRFWSTPDNPSVWAELLAADVDLINADDLPGLSGFLLSKTP